MTNAILIVLNKKTSYLGRIVAFLFANNYPNVCNSRNISEIRYFDKIPCFGQHSHMPYHHIHFKGALISLAVRELDIMCAIWLVFPHCQKVV